MAIILSTRFGQRQAGVGLGVLGLHLLVVMAWWSQQYHSPTLHHDAVVVPINVSLGELPKAAAPQSKAMPAHTVSTQQSSVRPKDPGHQASATTAPPVLADNAAPAAPTDSAGVSAPVSPGPALNLSLSSKDMAALAAPGYAAQSPFHGRLPVTVESAIANVAAQSGPWTEERVDLDHIRFRRGNTCIMMERPKAASLDPFNDAYARMPWKANIQDCP